MKILNFVIGLAIVIVLSGLFTLGIRAFYPIPEPPPQQIIMSSPPYCSLSEQASEEGEIKCAEELKKWEEQWHTTKAEYDSLIKKHDKEIDEYNKKVKTHNRNIFIIGNVVGVLLFIAGFILTKFSSKTALAVGIGTVISGLYAIITGYTIGWNSTDDRLKFFIGLIIAIILIGGGLLIGKHWKSKSADKNNDQQPKII